MREKNGKGGGVGETCCDVVYVSIVCMCICVILFYNTLTE